MPTVRYDAAVIKEAKRLVLSGVTPKVAAQRLDVPTGTLRRWTCRQLREYKDKNRPSETQIRWANRYIERHGEGGFLEWLGNEYSTLCQQYLNNLKLKRNLL